MICKELTVTRASCAVILVLRYRLQAIDRPLILDLTVPQCYLSLTMTSNLIQVMKLPSNGQVNGMMNGNAKKRFGVNKSAGILKPSTSCPNLTASDLNRNGYRNHRSSIDISSSGYPKPVLHFLLTSRLTFCFNTYSEC